MTLLININTNWNTSNKGFSNPQISNDDKARRIVSVVMNHVQNDPQEFYNFVSVLEAAGAWTKKMISKLKAFLLHYESGK